MAKLTDAQIKAVLAKNPNATDEQIAKAMLNNPAYGVTPQDIKRATGRDITGIRMAYGAGGGYSDEQINKALSQRFLKSGPLTAEEVNRAAIRYGISPEQLQNINPNLMQQTAGLKPALETLGGVEDRFRSDFAGAQEYQAPYREYGQQAAQRQAALTGALGPKAQRRALNEYMNSPALGYLQEQSERALTRNAAALGGLGGGNVRQDLTKLTADLYGQDFQNQFNRLGDIATRGYGAAATSAGLAQNMATGAANLGATGAGYQMQTGRDMSGNIGQTAVNLANTQTGLGGTQAGILSGLTGTQADIYTRLSDAYGVNVANDLLARANALQGMGGNLAGVQPASYQQVPGLNPQDIITAAGQGRDFLPTLFPSKSGGVYEPAFVNYQNPLQGQIQAGGPYVTSPAGISYDPSFIRGLA